MWTVVKEGCVLWGSHVDYVFVDMVIFCLKRNNVICDTFSLSLSCMPNKCFLNRYIQMLVMVCFLPVR